MKLETALTVAIGGANITTSATSAVVAIPTASNAAKARYVRVAATAAAYVRLVYAAGVAVAGDMLIQPGDDVILNTGGFTHIAAIQVAAAGVVNVTPLDD